MARVLLFGALQDKAGWRERALTPSPRTLSELRARLSADSPELAQALGGRGVRIAVDRVVIVDEASAVIGQNSEVAIMPPMSGG